MVGDLDTAVTLVELRHPHVGPTRWGGHRMVLDLAAGRRVEAASGVDLPVERLDTPGRVEA